MVDSSLAILHSSTLLLLFLCYQVMNCSRQQRRGSIRHSPTAVSTVHLCPGQVSSRAWLGELHSFLLHLMFGHFQSEHKRVHIGHNSLHTTHMSHLHTCINAVLLFPMLQQKAGEHT